ncbi:MAG TPA: GAF domain-containing protein, partial [Bacteroidales bacterium]|nr:GAF domain-containing protein [Bacteroidales bacterium]
MEKFSTINLRESNQSKKVRIGSDLKPVIQEKIITKWQSLIDTAARIVNVPSGLIMRLNEKTIEVFLKSNTPGNPYENGEEADLVYGLYCETVVGTQEKLIVPDASKSSVWKDNNPDVDINMISYLGFPINWPDGEVFGTVCMLDNKENHYTSDYENLLMQVKDHLENDLELLITNQELKEKSKQLEQLSKTKSRFLSLISHDVRGNIATNDEFIKMIIEDLDQYNNDSLKPLLESISKSTTESREILEDLLSWSRNDILQLKPEPEEINITAVIDKILRFFHHGISIKNI